LTFLFWNMGGESRIAAPTRSATNRIALLRSVLANLVRIHQVDVLMLAECPIPPQVLREAVNAGNSRQFQVPDAGSACETIAIFPAFSSRFLKREAESARFTCRRLRLPGREELLLVVVHLASKMHRSEDSQAMGLPQLSQIIQHLESKARHERTILVGDFNMNPFETGVVSAEGLNAVMTRELASRGGRTVDALEHPFFYNPMWSHFGDSTHELHPPGTPNHEPPGTCYYPAKESKWYYWNMFDQVLLRPALFSAFRNHDLRILVSDGTTAFLDARGIPKRTTVSDHLPILFRLDI
jgi:exonuclease III